MDKRLADEAVTSPSQSESEGEPDLAKDGIEGCGPFTGSRPPIPNRPTSSPFAHCFVQNFSVQRCSSPEGEDREILLQLKFDDREGNGAVPVCGMHAIPDAGPFCWAVCGFLHDDI